MAKVYVRRITLSNVCRSSATTRYRGLAVMAQVYSHRQSKDGLLIHSNSFGDGHTWKEFWCSTWRATCGLARLEGVRMNAISASFGSLVRHSSFFYQTPLALLALMLVWWCLPDDLGSANAEGSARAENAKASKLRRIDFLGAFLLATSIFAFLLLLNLLSKRLTFNDEVIVGLFLLWIGSCLLWVLVEARFAAEPIFPLRLLIHRDVLTTYLIVGLGITAHMSVTD